MPKNAASNAAMSVPATSPPHKVDIFRAHRDRHRNAARSSHRPTDTWLIPFLLHSVIANTSSRPYSHRDIAHDIPMTAIE